MSRKQYLNPWIWKLTETSLGNMLLPTCHCKRLKTWLLNIKQTTSNRTKQAFQSCVKNCHPILKRNYFDWKPCGPIIGATCFQNILFAWGTSTAPKPCVRISSFLNSQGFPGALGKRRKTFFKKIEAIRIYQKFRKFPGWIIVSRVVWVEQNILISKENIW